MSRRSPLRYPGGKSSLTPYIKSIVAELGVSSYYELYAGGAGIALELLLSDDVDNIVLNDADPHIFAFWNTVLTHSESLIAMIEETPVNVDTWRQQREVYFSSDGHSSIEVAFATFYLNRCNRSGIITKAGPIGGLDQKGKYKIDCRFNKQELIKRICNIAQRANRIELHNEDTLKFIKENLSRLADKSVFMYLDPPYYEKGKVLYLNYYKYDDHKQLRNLLEENRALQWLVSYDNVDEIRELYSEFYTEEHSIKYSLQDKRSAMELFVYSDTVSRNITKQ